MSSLENTAQSLEDDLVLKHQLPINKIKKISKLDPLLSSISAEAVLLVTLAAEKYIKLLGSAAYSYAKDDNRKTVQIKDIDRCIKKDWLFAILEDAINDWPEMQPKVYTKTAVPLPKGPSPVSDEVFEEGLEQDIDRLIDQQSFQRDQLNIQKHNYREKVNDNLLRFASANMPKYDQEDIQLLLGGEPGEMMVEKFEDTKDSMQQTEVGSSDADGADTFEEEHAQQDPLIRGIPDIEDF